MTPDPTASPAPLQDDPEERQLVTRSAAGDQDAFRQLVLRHHRRVVNIAYRALGDASLAEDVAQEVFIKVYRHLPSYRHEKPFVHWLHRVAANTVTDAARRHRPVQSLDSLEQPLAGQGGDPQEVAARHDLQRSVRRAIATLPPHYRDTLALQVYHDLSYEDIARTLDVPIGTVMSRLNAAKRLLRDRLQALADAEGGANTP
jgi:RNA polymerase sigma-70 factor (ECF subfamily)